MRRIASNENATVLVLGGIDPFKYLITKTKHFHFKVR